MLGEELERSRWFGIQSAKRVLAGPRHILWVLFFFFQGKKKVLAEIHTTSTSHEMTV